jgi:hypothetical protein
VERNVAATSRFLGSLGGRTTWLGALGAVGEFMGAVGLTFQAIHGAYQFQDWAHEEFSGKNDAYPIGVGPQDVSQHDTSQAVSCLK